AGGGRLLADGLAGAGEDLTAGAEQLDLEPPGQLPLLRVQQRNRKEELLVAREDGGGLVGGGRRPGAAAGLAEDGQSGEADEQGGHHPQAPPAQRPARGLIAWHAKPP